MCDIITLLICLSPYLNRTHLHQLACISEALLSMTGRITMLGISRWTGKGGSYRTLQRFFNTTIPWCRIHWFLIRHRLLDKQDTILISGDETEVTKSGKKTYGLDRFFSSIFGKAVPGISFLCLSLLSVNNNLSMPVMMEQVIKDEDEASQSSKKKKNTKKKKATKNKKSARRGRPPGSKNKNKKEVELSPYLLWMKALIMNLLRLIGSDITIVYFVFDGAFGNNACLQMVRGTGLHLISKLRCDSALWFPFKGVQSKKGAPKKYGKT
jgi:putative transposase